MRIDGAIDKLDIRIRAGTRFVKMLERELLTSSLTHPHGSSRYFGAVSTPNSMRPKKHYFYACDLRIYGVNAILYFRNRRSGEHKLEIISTGTMAFSQILSEIGNVFEVNPLKLEIMRIDLAVDMPHYSVEWFRHNVRVAQKRYTSEFDLAVSERKQCETLYFGQRPNLLRIYDKTAERRVRYKQLVRKWKSDNPVPSFQERYGHPDDAIITRVERQYGGGRVPKAIGTMGQLQTNGVNLNPYECLQFLPIAVSDESINQLSGDAYIKGQGLLRLLEREGYHGAKRLLYLKTCRNTHRVLERLWSAMPSNDVSEPDLFFNYQRAIKEQLWN